MADHATFDTVIDVEDNTGNLLPEDQRTEASKAVLDGQNSAKENAKAEAKVNTNPYLDDTAANRNIEEAKEVAELNHKVDVANQGEGYELAKNDTSKAGKTRTAQSQLDPTGNDPINKADVARSATNAGEGSGTSVSNEEVAKRAEEPGKAEEKSPLSTANGGADVEKLKATESAVHANSNEGKNTGQGGIAKELAGPANGGTSS